MATSAPSPIGADQTRLTASSARLVLLYSNNDRGTIALPSHVPSRGAAAPRWVTPQGMAVETLDVVGMQ